MIVDGYRQNVGMMLFNSIGKIFLAHRPPPVDYYQMPQGGIDKGENPVQAVYREMKEEIGTNNVELVHESTIWRRYDYPKAHAKQKGYKGQSQKWFLFKFLGNDSEFNFQTHEQEFDGFKWDNIESAPKGIIPFKRNVFQLVVEEFGPIIKQYLSK